MICLCVNPKISSAEPGMPSTTLWGTYLYLQSRTGCSHTQAGPAQERVPCICRSRAQQSLAEWHHLSLKGEPKCQPAQGDKEHPGEGHKGSTDEQRLALLPQGSQLGPLLNFSQHSSIENYSKLLTSIWQSWHQQRQSKALLSSFMSWRIWLWGDKGPAEHVGSITRVSRVAPLSLWRCILGLATRASIWKYQWLVKMCLFWIFKKSSIILQGETVSVSLPVSFWSWSSYVHMQHPGSSH